MSSAWVSPTRQPRREIQPRLQTSSAGAVERLPHAADLEGWAHRQRGVAFLDVAQDRYELVPRGQYRGNWIRRVRPNLNRNIGWSVASKLETGQYGRLIPLDVQA